MPEKQKGMRIVPYKVIMLNPKFHKDALATKEEIKKANNILIIAHKNPDGDAAGSALALYETFKEQGKNPSVFCVDSLPENLFFLPNFEVLKNDFGDIKDFDLVFCVDCGANYMTGIHETTPEIFGGSFSLVNIDHHASNEGFGKWNIIDETAASTTLIITELLRFWDIKINHRAATSLLCGLFTDTGSFQHSNTNPRELRTAAFLMRQGGTTRQISKSIFHNNKASVLELWGRVLSRVYKDNKGVVISNVSDEDFWETRTEPSDLSGVINYLNSVPDSQFSLLLTETNGKVKASFRTMRDDVDVAEIASNFGGGGHKKAAGFTINGYLEKEVKWKIIQN